MSGPDDDKVQARIAALEEEERGLRRDEAAASDAADDSRVSADAKRLEQIRLELDQLWDYLRQRRALREAGHDPNDAQLRGSDTVEGYLG